MSPDLNPLHTPEGRIRLAEFYRETLTSDVMPFWERHGLDREFGGLLTALDRDGTVIDTDKSVWFQGRAAWMWATLFLECAPRTEWLAASRSCADFLRRHAAGPDGKLYFSVTRDGQPLRMRRYVYSEAFAAIGLAAFARAARDDQAAAEAAVHFDRYLLHSFTPGVMPPKTEAARPSKGLAPLMIALVTAQELRLHLGDHPHRGRTCTEWIDHCIAEIERDFLKPEHDALMEQVAPDGAIIDHFDGRLLNPGHALECAWFILREARLRRHAAHQRLGLTILDGMWKRGWDAEYGGLFYFRDLHGRPVQEYWHDMKFWWPHAEAILATLLAWRLTGAPKYADWHRQVHDWSFTHFPDPEHGEWYGYLHRDGRVSVPLKGNLWKGPFHLPRMLWVGHQILADPPPPAP